MTWTRLELSDIAAAVAYSVCIEIGRESEEQCRGADAIAVLPHAEVVPLRGRVLVESDFAHSRDRRI